MERDQDVAELKLMPNDYRENLAASQARLERTEAKVGEYLEALEDASAQLKTCQENLTTCMARLRATEVALEATRDLVERFKRGRVLGTMMRTQEFLRRLRGSRKPRLVTPPPSFSIPSLSALPSQPPPSEYVRVWEGIAASPAGAYQGVTGSTSEEDLVVTGRVSADCLRRGLKIEPSHKVLEVGCGVARIGLELAPHCLEWHGCDISDNMIQIGRRRTAGQNNVHLRTLRGCSLEDYPDNYFDRVYCHIVLFHLQKEDVYGYIQEMRRVLKPNGIAYYDTWNLCNEAGWERWELIVAEHKDPNNRPIHRNRWSTPEEMRMFTEKAGLHIVKLLDQTWFVQVLATKVSEGDDPGLAVNRLRDELAGAWEVLIPKVKWCAFTG